MLVTTLDHAAGNDYLAARFQKAYAFLNRDDLGSLPLGRVDVAVLAPEDAHKPGCALDAPCCVRKIVVKVLV